MTMDSDLSDLEVASVLSLKVSSSGTHFERKTKSANLTPKTQVASTQSPYRASTVLSNIERGNVQTVTPSFEGEITPYQLAAQGELSLLQELISNGLDVNAADCYGFTLLFWACSYGQLSVMKFLLQKGANVNHVSPIGENCLHFASHNGFSLIVEQLVQYGVDIDCSDENGESALMYAVRGRHVNCVAVLLQHGIDLTIENHEGNTAMEIAIQCGFKDVQRKIEEHMLRIMT